MILDQEAINEMLNNISGDDENSFSRKKIKIYDFKRPDKFSRDQIRAIMLIHDGFARLASTYFTGALHTQTRVHVASVDQLTFSEFMLSIANPTVLGMLGIPQLNGSAIIEINPSLMFTMIDRMLGGHDLPENPLYRELTEIETGLSHGIISSLITNLSVCWNNLINLQPVLEKIEFNPQFAQILPPQDMVLLVSLEVKIGHTSGYINLVLPYITIEPIIPLLSGTNVYEKSSQQKDSPKTTLNKISSLKIDTEVVVKSEALSLHEIGQLKKGSLIHLPDFKSGKAKLFSNDDPIMSLRFSENKKDRLFTFEVVDDGTSHDAQAILNNPVKPEDTMKSMLEEPFAKLTDKFNRSIMDLQDQLDHITDLRNEAPKVTVEPTTEIGQVTILPTEVPFSFLRSIDHKHYAAHLMQEHPQTIALILTYLPPADASVILGQVPPELQGDIISRISVTEQVTPEVVGVVERILKFKLETMQAAKHKAPDRIMAIVEILNASNREVEKSIIDNLNARNPELALRLKKDMFIFEDISTLDAASIRIILEKVDQNDLALSLKTVSNELKEKILTALNAEKQAEIIEKILELGNVGITVIEKAQGRIIDVIRGLEEDGTIFITRSDFKKP